MSRTVVCFHAHPDDESLLMGGTMARLAAEGHRVVLVTATAGEAGLAARHLVADTDLGTRRWQELQNAADALRCARVVPLEYADSGMRERPSGASASFAECDVDSAAARLAAILIEEQADVVTIYDPAGGYGHPDHVQVHHVGLAAARIAGTPVVLEATLNRDALRRAAYVLRAAGFGRRFPEARPRAFDGLYVGRAQLTHRVNVRDYLDQKRAALEAHRSQATSDDSARMIAGLLQLPGPVFRLALGHEWFVEHGRAPGGRLLDDVLASLREKG